MGLIQTDDQLRFALLAISTGSDEALQRTRAPTKDLKSSSNNVINVPSNSNHSKRNSSSPTSIKDIADSCNENGVLSTSESGALKSHNVCVEGVRAISSNGKARIKDGIVACHLARKRYGYYHSNLTCWGNPSIGKI